MEEKKFKLSPEKCLEIAEKVKCYCFYDVEDNIYLGAKAIPIIFKECLKAINPKD